jgi:hypothetical protein
MVIPIAPSKQKTPQAAKPGASMSYRRGSRISTAKRSGYTELVINADGARSTGE